MEYNRLTRITNKYPQTGNYITTGIGKSSLFGLYDEVNKIDFDLPKLDDISIVSDTSIRTLVAIYEDRNDTTPQYYTSEIYHRDLSASRIEANPYFLQASFNPSHIVNIYLKEIVNSGNSYKEAELKRGLIFSRNNFILYSNAGISSPIGRAVARLTGNANSAGNSNNEANTSVITNQLNLVNSEISKLENEITNVPSKLKRFGIFGSRAKIDFDGATISSKIAFNRDKQVDDIKTQLGTKLLALKDRKKKIENFITESGTTKIVTKALKEENIKIDKIGFLEKIKNKSVGVPKAKDIIEINGVFVDCILLVKYIDWVLSDSNIDEIEDGGVIAPELLLEFEEAPKETAIDELDGNKNPIGTDTPPSTNTNTGTGNYFEYQIIRLSIPAAQAASTMTFKTSNGNIETISTANYGPVGTYCIEENSFGGNYNLYQRTQLAPCNIPANPSGGGGGYRGGGSYDYYDNQNRNIDYIDRQRDFQNIQ
jgi:hypothetical protein